MYEKSRLWCFTNYRLDFDYKELIKAGKVRYILYGVETAPTTGRVHHQGFCWLKTQCGSYKTMSRMFKCQPGDEEAQKGCWVKMCDGSWDENVEYCTKDANVFTFGKEPQQGARGDVAANVKKIENG